VNETDLGSGIIKLLCHPSKVYMKKNISIL
jgi:hypothetical protein